jgi:hypothetical protein
MIRIAVSLAAYKAIVATLSDDMVPIPPEKSPQGEYLLILDQRTMARLTKLRGRGESYSDAILRLASADAYRAGSTRDNAPSAQQGRRGGK